MMAGVSGYGQPYWAELNKQSKEIEGFLKSLSPTTVGGGVVLYNPDLFILKPRSAYFNSTLTQRIVRVLKPEEQVIKEVPQIGLDELQKNYQRG
jgi:hypothetical protein